MKKILTLLFALIILSLVGCSIAPKEYIVKDSNTQTTQTQSLPQSTEPVEEVKKDTAVTEVNFIGNANSYKFHKPECSSVDQMNESNKVFITTREDAIEDGYESCQRCNP